MHLPFIQVASEIIDQVAPDVAVILGVSENEVLGGLVRLFRWALGRVPEGALPSDHAIVSGPNAARLIAGATHLAADPEAVIDALANCHPEPLLERVGDGIRVRGLRRYDVAVNGAEVRTERARNAANARWRQTDAQAMPEQCLEHAVSIAQPMLGDAKTQTQTQTHITAAAAGRTRELAPELRTGDAWWTFAQERRARLRPDAADDIRPKGLPKWLASALEIAGPDLGLAYERYLADAAFADRGWPMAVFMAEAVWRSRVPKGPAPPLRDALTGVGRGAA